MSNKVLVVYNTCGLSGKENVGWYINCLRSILDQDFDDFAVVVSSCTNSSKARSAIQKEFGEKVHINCVDLNLPVNITFNTTVRNTVSRFGAFDYYVYVDSGIHFGYDRKTLSDIWLRASTNKYGLISIQASNDNGFNEWFGKEFPIVEEDYVVPIGKAFNAHTIAYSHDVYEAFGGRLVPDIFAAYCTESVFSYLAAAVGKEWIIVCDRIHYHMKGSMGADGASVGSDKIGKYGEPWNNLVTGQDIRKILNDPEAWNCGFGYEECNSVFLHNSSVYDKNHCLDPERLRAFMNANMFVRPDQLNYDSLPSLFVK